MSMHFPVKRTCSLNHHSIIVLPSSPTLVFETIKVFEFFRVRVRTNSSKLGSSTSSQEMKYLWTILAVVLSCLSYHRVNSEVISNSGGNSKLYLCLHNCALCVRIWESGLYNGEKCAKKCLKYKSNPRIVDPDCDQLKMFNQKALKRKIAAKR